MSSTSDTASSTTDPATSDSASPSASSDTGTSTTPSPTDSGSSTSPTDSSTQPPPPSTTSDSSTSDSSTTAPPPTSDSGSTAQPSGTDTSSEQSSSTDSSSSTTSTLTAPQTTVVQTTVVQTSNGQVFTTIFRTSSVIPSGATVTSGGTDASNSNSSSSSHTGAIVGGVVGGVVGLIALLLILWGVMRWRRNRYNSAFDGNFDPDRLGGRPDAGFGGTLPNIPVDDEDPNHRQMEELEDDGMGGRLNASTVGGGIVTPYQLHHHSNSQPNSLGHAAGAQYANYPANLNQYGPNQYSPGSPPMSASAYGGSVDGHGQNAYGPGMMAMPAPDWRHPSPGPSLAATHTTGNTDSPGSPTNLYAAGAAAYGGRAPSVVSSSHSGSGGGGIATPGRLAKEREAYGMYQNQNPNAPPSAFNAFGPGPNSTQLPPAGAYNGNGKQRRYSGQSAQTQTQTNSDGGRASGQGHGLAVANPDEDDAQGYAGGWSEDARRMYLAGGPIGGPPGQQQQAPSSKGPAPRSGPGPSSVLVHQDGGRIPQQEQQEDEQGPEEIPPTYDSLLPDSSPSPASRAGASGATSPSARSGSASPRPERR